MPQLVQGSSLSADTYFSASRITAATCSGVSTTSEATSITPTITSLPFSRPISSIGTWLLAHSRLTWVMLLAARAGNTCSYWRQLSPSVSFHFRLASMP